MKFLPNKGNKGEIVLLVLFVIYLIMGYNTPLPLANLIDTTYGKVVVILVALALFSHTSIVLGILVFIVAYQLIMKSSMSTGSFALENYVPTEEKKTTYLTAQNQFPYTLEQEIVKKMTAPCNADLDAPKNYSWKPMLEDNYDAAPIGYTGVI